MLDELDDGITRANTKAPIYAGGENGVPNWRGRRALSSDSAADGGCAQVGRRLHGTSSYAYAQVRILRPRIRVRRARALDMITGRIG